MSGSEPGAATADLDYGFAPGELQTLDAVIGLRAERDRERPFVTFLADGDRDERVLTFGRLRERGLAVAGLLAARGLKPGDRVLIMLPSGLEFVETFCGCLLGGLAPVPVYPPARLARLEHYLRTLAAISDTATCRAVVVDDRLVPLVGKALTAEGAHLVTDLELKAATQPGTPYPLEPGSAGFLQFTSGTTSQPRGVMLEQRHLMAQLQSYSEALQLAPQDTVVTWLPLYHDLGLIGKVLACLYVGSPLVLQSPIDFLKDPMTWLRAISRYRAVHVAAPNFAYQLAVRKCPHDRLEAEGIDLASVENAGMGGEPVSWATVEAFRAHFASYGFKPGALNPCYGLAENTLVATGHRRNEPLRTVTVSLAGLQRNAVEPPAGDDDRFTVVGNGRPFPRMTVRIADAEGGELGSDAVGEIWVSGPSVAAGYLGDRAATAATFVERDERRWVRTGDLGFVSAGDLYICGRSKDVLIVRGRNFHPQDLEQEAGRIAGVRTGNVVAFAAPGDDGDEVAILVAETDPRSGRADAEVRSDVIEAVAGAFQLTLSRVILLPKGSLPKTSSGKLQRSLVKEAYARGDLGALAPPGWLQGNLLKLRLGAAALGRRLRPRRGGPGEAAPSGEQSPLDPRFDEALRAFRKDLAFTPTADQRLDGLGLDSVERVELMLELERAFRAKVPEDAWNALQTLGELQALLEQHAGTAPAREEDDGEDPTGPLVRELLTPLEEAPPPFQAPLTAPLMFGFLSGVSRTFWRWTVEGHEHLDRPDGFLIAGNHVTYLDGAWLRNAVTPEVRARLAAYSWSGLPAFTRVFLRQMDTIPVDPLGSFRLAIRSGLQALAQDKVLLIFPEGKRTHSGRMDAFRPGVALLSLLSGKPIVPFRSRGMFEIYPRDRALPRFFGWRRGDADRLVVTFGPAIHPPPHEPGRTWEQADALIRELRAAVEAL